MKLTFNKAANFYGLDYNGYSKYDKIVQVKSPTETEVGHILYNQQKYSIEGMLDNRNLEDFYFKKVNILAGSKRAGYILPKFKIHNTIFGKTMTKLYYEVNINEEKFKAYNVLLSNNSHFICLYNLKNELIGELEEKKDGEFSSYAVYSGDSLVLSILLLYFNEMKGLRNKKIVKCIKNTSLSNRSKYDADFVKRIDVLDKVS